MQYNLKTNLNLVTLSRKVSLYLGKKPIHLS